MREKVWCDRRNAFCDWCHALYAELTTVCVMTSSTPSIDHVQEDIPVANHETAAVP